MNPSYSPQYMHELKTRLLKKFPQLIELDFSAPAYSQKDMLRMISYKLGITKKELQTIIKDL